MVLDGIGLSECRERYVNVGTVPSFDVQGHRGFVKLLQALEGESLAMPARKRRHAAEEEKEEEEEEQEKRGDGAGCRPGM